MWGHFVKCKIWDALALRRPIVQTWQCGKREKESDWIDDHACIPAYIHKHIPITSCQTWCSDSWVFGVSFFLFVNYQKLVIIVTECASDSWKYVAFFNSLLQFLMTRKNEEENLFKNMCKIILWGYWCAPWDSEKSALLLDFLTNPKCGEPCWFVTRMTLTDF